MLHVFSNRLTLKESVGQQKPTCSVVYSEAGQTAQPTLSKQSRTTTAAMLLEKNQSSEHRSINFNLAAVSFNNDN